MANPFSFKERLQAIRDRIAAAAARASRDPAGIRLIAVTKGQPATAVREAFEAGLREFGENYLEEAEPKIHALDPAIAWHMIGHVQSRKAKSVAVLFPMIHSVDSLGLAQRLSRSATEAGRLIVILLECNLAGESSKTGFPAADPSAWGGLFPEWEQILALPGLSTAGLMTMPPYAEDPELSRPVFGRLRALRELARRALPQAGWRELSMGMSDDFEQAVEEGATLVRIGRALFGPRPPRAPAPPSR